MSTRLRLMTANELRAAVAKSPEIQSAVDAGTIWLEDSMWLGKAADGQAVMLALDTDLEDLRQALERGPGEW